MIIVGNQVDPKKLVYAWIDNGVYFLSRSKSTVAQRPINRYDTKEELEQAALIRGVTVVWES